MGVELGAEGLYGWWGWGQRAGGGRGAGGGVGVGRRGRERPGDGDSRGDEVAVGAQEQAGDGRPGEGLGRWWGLVGGDGADDDARAAGAGAGPARELHGQEGVERWEGGAEGLSHEAAGGDGAGGGERLGPVAAGAREQAGSVGEDEHCGRCAE